MSAPELHRTLTALVEAISPAPGGGLRIDRADLLVPLEVTMRSGPDGPALHARVPHSRWISGFQPPVALSRLTIEAVPDGG